MAERGPHVIPNLYLTLPYSELNTAHVPPSQMLRFPSPTLDKGFILYHISFGLPVFLFV